MSTASVVESASGSDAETTGRDSALSALPASVAREIGKTLPWRRLHGICDCDRYGQLRLPHRLSCVTNRISVSRGLLDTTRKESTRSIQTRLDVHGGLPWKPNRRQGARYDRRKGL